MSNIINTFDNRMNPIVVKELRQGMQSWFIIIIVNLLLVALSLTCILMVMTNPEITDEATGGRDMFLFLQGLLFIATVLCVPVYVLARLRSERNGEHVDLFFTTSLKPHKIIRGKFIAGMSLVTLLYSVCLPFMLFTYVLRGYDIPSMLFSLSIGYFASIPIIMAAIVIGTWTIPRIFAPFTLFTVTGALVPVIGGLCSLCYEILREGVQDIFREDEAILVVLIVLGAGFLLFKLLEAMAIGLLSPPSSNRTARLRVWITITIFALAAGFAAFGAYFGLMVPYGPGWLEVCMFMTFAWTIISLSLVAIMILIAMCEPDRFSNRIMLQRPRRFLVRVIAFPFTHGASCGFLWATIHVAVILTIFFVVVNFLPLLSGHGFYHSSDIKEEIVWPIIIFSCVVAYALLAKLIMRMFFQRVPAKHTWVTFLFIFMILAVSSMVTCFAIDSRHWDKLLFWKLFNPMADISGMGSLDSGSDILTRVVIDVGWALTMLACCLPHGLRDAKRYFFETQKLSDSEEVELAETLQENQAIPCVEST